MRERFDERAGFGARDRDRPFTHETGKPLARASGIERAETGWTGECLWLPHHTPARHQQHVVDAVFQAVAAHHPGDRVTSAGVSCDAHVKRCGLRIPDDWDIGGLTIASGTEAHAREQPFGLAEPRPEIALQREGERHSLRYGRARVIATPRSGEVRMTGLCADDRFEDRAIADVRQTRDQTAIETDRLRFAPVARLSPLAREDFDEELTARGRSLDIQHVEQLAARQQMRRRWRRRRRRLCQKRFPCRRRPVSCRGSTLADSRHAGQRPDRLREWRMTPLIRRREIPSVIERRLEVDVEPDIGRHLERMRLIGRTDDGPDVFARLRHTNKVRTGARHGEPRAFETQKNVIGVRAPHLGRKEAGLSPRLRYAATREVRVATNARD